MRPRIAGTFQSAADILGSLRGFARARTDRLMILNQVWEKEVGALARHWALSAVKGGTVFVRPSSPAAAQELQLRGRELVRGLNKHFDKAWIREIRTSRE
ncbi:MAG TPA: hypothetical protein DCM05_05795 [Elusimicrobia bacterium]|nr:hypothetical protein [Elusimicrobiota bacterium]